jgi:Tol biopolymer transport system component
MGNDLAVSLSHDGQILFTYQDSPEGNGDLLISYLKDSVYSQPKKLTGEINTYAWEGSCSLSPDGKILYFSSNREGGYGGKDIYRAKLLSDSTWGNIINLGDSINTPYDEDAPFIHADGRTLFYSSNGLKSSGGYDIFRSLMENDSTFKKTENLGYPINSPVDDIYFSLTANGNKAYYSAQKKGGEGLTDL